MANSRSKVDDEQPDERDADEQPAHVHEPSVEDEGREDRVENGDEQQCPEQQVRGEPAFFHTTRSGVTDKTSRISAAGTRA